LSALEIPTLTFDLSYVQAVLSNASKFLSETTRSANIDFYP
jgi:hypothetical protein